MENKTCEGCYFADNCKSKSACEYYTPADGEITESELYSIIEAERAEYYSDWFEYIHNS